LSPREAAEEKEGDQKKVGRKGAKLASYRRNPNQNIREARNWVKTGLGEENKKKKRKKGAVEQQSCQACGISVSTSRELRSNICFSQCGVGSKKRKKSTEREV